MKLQNSVKEYPSNLICANCPHCWGITVDKKSCYTHVWCGYSYMNGAGFDEIRNNICPHVKGV